MLTAEEFIMSKMTTYRGFGNGQIVDISNYNGREKEAQENTKRGKFIYFGFLDLSKYYDSNGNPNFLHPDLLNIAIRAKQNLENNDGRIARDYKRRGWNYGPFPLQADINTGVPKNGRTRIRAALRNRERFIPCAWFNYQETKIVSKHVQNLSEGLIANDGLVSTVTKFEDLVEAGIDAVTEGGVKEDKQSILELLANEFEADRFVDTSDFTKIADMILDAVHEGQQAMMMLSRSEVIEYLKKSPDLPADAVFASIDTPIPVGKKRVFVYSAPSRSNMGRLWANIAHEIPKGSYVVLYTTKKFPSKIKRDYMEFMDYQTKRYEECFEIVNLSNDQFQVKVPDKQPWKLLGFMPQLNTVEHQTLLQYHQLATYEHLN